jgi:hypothetical protein
VSLAPSLTRPVKDAQSGLRRDVQKLIDAVPSGRLVVPLQRRLTAVRSGTVARLDQSIDIAPHFVPDHLGHPLIALFTFEGPLERVVPSLHWTTDRGPLEICWLPAKAGLQLAYKACDEPSVAGCVLDAGAPSELQLKRAEIRAILDERAIPLVNYAKVTLADVPIEPPAEGVRNLVEYIVTRHPEVIRYRLERLFDPERELEPRLVLTLRVKTSSEGRQELANEIGGTICEELPAFATVQVRFES